MKFMLDAFVQGLRENSFTEMQIEQVERQICPAIEAKTIHTFGGERVYIPKREDVSAEIAARFNGKNIDKLSRELRVSRRTVYRALRKRTATK